MGNFNPVFSVPISGGHAFGDDGYIDITSNSTDNVNDQTTSLDVARWEIVQNYENAPLLCSGLLGTTDARRIGYSYSFRAEVIWDANSPPDLLFRGLGSASTPSGGACALYRGVSGCELVFWYGTTTRGAIQISPPQPPEDRYYWSPDAIIESAVPVVDANGKRVNRVVVDGRFRSHVFLCPDQGIPSDSTTLAGAYFKWWQTY